MYQKTTFWQLKWEFPKAIWSPFCNSEKVIIGSVVQHLFSIIGRSRSGVAWKTLALGAQQSWWEGEKALSIQFLCLLHFFKKRTTVTSPCSSPFKIKMFKVLQSLHHFPWSFLNLPPFTISILRGVNQNCISITNVVISYSSMRALQNWLFCF